MRAKPAPQKNITSVGLPFFEDLSSEIIQDNVFERLMTFSNVIVTGHQAFFTEDALSDIAEMTLANLSDFEQERECVNEIKTKELG